MRFNIESNILHIESIAAMTETVTTIRETSEQYQLVQGNLDVSKLESSLDALCEQRDASHEIQSVLNDLHSTESYDDEALLEELEALSQERAQGGAGSGACGVVAEPGLSPAARAVASLPAAPTGSPRGGSGATALLVDTTAERVASMPSPPTGVPQLKDTRRDVRRNDGPAACRAAS